MEVLGEQRSRAEKRAADGWDENKELRAKLAAAERHEPQLLQLLHVNSEAMEILGCQDGEFLVAAAQRVVTQRDAMATALREVKFLMHPWDSNSINKRVNGIIDAALAQPGPDAGRGARDERQAIATRLRNAAAEEVLRLTDDFESDLPREAREYAADLLCRLADELDPAGRGR